MRRLFAALALVILLATPAWAAFPVVEATNTTEVSGATSTPVINLPTGVAAGDLLLVWVRQTNEGTAIGWPGDWVELFEDSSDASNDTTALGCLVAAGGETTVTLSGGSNRWAGLSWRISGADNCASVEWATLVTGTGTTPDPGNLAPAGGADDYVWLWIGSWEGEQTSPPTGTPTDYADNRIGASTGTGGTVPTNCRAASAKRSVNAASQNPGSWTISASDDWTATVVAVSPAPPPPACTAGLNLTLLGVGGCP